MLWVEILCTYANISSMQAYIIHQRPCGSEDKWDLYKLGQFSGASVCFVSYSEPSSSREHTPLICYTLSHHPKHSHTLQAHSHKWRSRAWSQSKIAESRFDKRHASSQGILRSVIHSNYMKTYLWLTQTMFRFDFYCTW